MAVHEGGRGRGIPTVEEECAMANSITEIYRSSNGDRWQLVRTGDPANALVRHIPNASSGGSTTDTAVADFLSVDGTGPEFAALRRLLENSADEPRDS
jgi:hypothetical protein